MLKIKDLKVSYGKLKVLKGINLEIKEGERVGVIGESGTGKTTLAKSTVGILEPEEGKVYLEGKKVTQRNKEFYKKIQMIFQNPRESLSHS